MEIGCGSCDGFNDVGATQCCDGSALVANGSFSSCTACDSMVQLACTNSGAGGHPSQEGGCGSTSFAPKKPRLTSGISPMRSASGGSNVKHCPCEVEGLNEAMDNPTIACNMKLYRSCRHCCRYWQDAFDMRSATGGRFRNQVGKGIKKCHEWGFSPFSGCGQLEGTEIECRNWCTERPSGLTQFRQATSSTTRKCWSNCPNPKFLPIPWGSPCPPDFPHHLNPPKCVQNVSYVNSTGGNSNWGGMSFQCAKTSWVG